MYTILTSKPGLFRTEIIDGMRPIEAYDYFFYGQKRAHFVIAELLNEAIKVRVIEDGSEIVNDVPSKFLGKFESVEGAFNELKHLTTFGHMETDLRKTAIAAR